MGCPLPLLHCERHMWMVPKVKGGYKFIFSTEIDGKTVAQTIREFECTEL